MNTSIAFARMQSVKKIASGCMRDKLDYVGRKGRYAHRRDLVAGPCTTLPPSAPKRFRDEHQLWSAAEDQERAGGLVALELLVALPSDAIMSKAEAMAFCRELAETLVAEHGIAVTFAIHDGDDADDQGEPIASEAVPNRPSEGAAANRHAHCLLTTRQLSPKGFGRRRYDALLPTIVGRSLSRSAVLGRVHVADAANFHLWIRRSLERFLARAGKSMRLRLDAIHHAHHVGPVAATRVLLNDLEAMARRPDGAAHLRKINRLRVNSEIEMRNRRAVAAVTPLLEHLADRIFQRCDVEALVQRYCDWPEEASRIVQAVMDHTLVFAGSGASGTEQFYILPAYRERETRISNLAAQLVARSPRSGNQDIGLIGQVTAGRRVSLVEVTDESHANRLDTLVEELQDAGEVVAMATHLNKRRAPPPNIRLLPLHWQEPPTIPEGAVVLVDEADDISLPQLERLLSATLSADARLLLCRRSYHADFLPHPTLSALVKGAQETYGPDTLTDYRVPFQLEQGKTVLFEQDLRGVVQLAAQCNEGALRRGKGVFFVSGDPHLTELLLENARLMNRQIQIARCVPPQWHGPVIVLHAGMACSPAHLQSISPLKPRFIVAQTSAVDLAEFATQLRQTMGHLTTLTDALVPNFVATSPSNGAKTLNGKFLERKRGPESARLGDALSSVSLPIDDDIQPDDLNNPDRHDVDDDPNPHPDGEVTEFDDEPYPEEFEDGLEEDPDLDDDDDDPP